MKPFLPFLMVVGGNVLYHLSQKMVPRDTAPQWALLFAYISSTLCTGLMFYFQPSAPPPALTKLSLLPIIGIGVSAFVIEAGYLLFYRYGGDISTAPVAAAAAVALVLIPIGAWLLNENVNAQTLLGVALCLAGLYVIVRSTS